MANLDKPISRRTRASLGGNYGIDRNRRLVATLEPGDIITLRPEGTRRAESVSLLDVYHFAIRCKTNRANLEKARKRKVKLQAIAEAKELKARFRTRTVK